MEGHEVGPNWAEISIALLTAFGLFGEGFRRYIRGQIAYQDTKQDKKRNEQTTALELQITKKVGVLETEVVKRDVAIYGKIADQRGEIDEEMVDLRNDLSEKIRAEGAAVGEGLAAIRVHTGQIELWVRDNLVRAAVFDTAMINVNTNMKSISDDVRRLLERLLDKNKD